MKPNTKEKKFDCTCNPDRHWPPVLCAKHAKPNTKERKAKPIEYQIMMTIGCVWCGSQIEQNRYSEHPRQCVFFQEYIRQLI